jgi:hypothetical protein
MIKKLATGILLAFVAIAVIAVLVRNRGDGGGQAVPLQPMPGPGVAAPAAATPASHLVAFYFHGTKRCQSCNSIERLTREALKAETEAGRVEIRSVNVDDAPNAHYVDDFQLAMRTVVLAEEAGGTVVRWKRLDECWDRFADPPDFLAYVQQSLGDFREPAAVP